MNQKLLLLLLGITISVSAITDTIVLQQGSNDYYGTSDTYIGQGLPANSSNQGHQTYTHAGRC